MIELHILGAGGAFPTASHGPAAYWLTIDGHGLLLEAGCGALVRLVRQPAAPDSLHDIPLILLSHLHLDHTADLAPLFFALHAQPVMNPAPLVLAGPRGLAAYLQRLRDLYGDWLETPGRELAVREVAPGQSLPLPGGGLAAAFAVEHNETRFGGHCLGWSFRDKAGKRLVYSGDTGPCDALADAARGCDLLLIECTTPDHLTVAGHHSPGQVAALVRRAQPAQVVLTHLGPLVARQEPDTVVSDTTGVSCRAARDGDVITLGESKEPPCP